MIETGKLVWYLGPNGVYSAPVLSIMTVQNEHNDWNHTKEQKELFNRFGSEGTFIATVHGVYPLDKVFESKEDLLKSI